MTERRAAIPDTVLAAPSDPERVARWWGPDGFTNTIHRFEFTDGGSWLQQFEVLAAFVAGANEQNLDRLEAEVMRGGR